MVDSDRNAQAKFLDALKDKSLQSAVDILEGIHDGKEALNHASPRRPAAGPAARPRHRSSRKLGDVRRVGDLIFDVAASRSTHWTSSSACRQARVAARGPPRRPAGLPLRGNRAQVLELVIPVRAVEADRRERPGDGEATTFCEIHRQFRAKNLTARDWPSSAGVTAVKLTWSREPEVKPRALRVSVLRDPRRCRRRAGTPRCA
ncbi:MAG: hypothetical protein IPN17_06620 [Deltaproteobacteria bacterium]|nr:hypothetical protein [Deltaproteobacteria bacterium]